MKTLWLVSNGTYYNSYQCGEFVTKTKKAAVAICRKEGFKYSEKDELWCNDHINVWRKIERIEIREIEKEN